MAEKKLPASVGYFPKSALAILKKGEAKSSKGKKSSKKK